MVVCLTLKVCSADLTSFSAVNETSWKSGTECLGAYCTTKKGHFSDSSLVTNGNVRTYDKQLNPGIYTNFVVYIKNVQSTYESMMTLCTAWNQCVVVSTKETKYSSSDVLHSFTSVSTIPLPNLRSN